MKTTSAGNLKKGDNVKMTFLGISLASEGTVKEVKASGHGVVIFLTNGKSTFLHAAEPVRII